MRTSYSKDGRCPACNGRTAQDLQEQGYVRHIDKIQVGVDDNGNPVYCGYDLGGRDHRSNHRPR
jgi:hypothetical protein